MKSGKKYLGIALVFLLFVLGACGKSSKDSSSSDGKTEVKITWRNTGENDNVNRYLSKTFVPEFEKENPDIKIVLSPITASEGDYFSKVALSLQSENTAPDVVSEDTFMINSDVNAGYLTNLDERLNSWDQWENFTDTLKEGVTAEDGSYYAIPATTDSRGIWYNKNVFKKAGLPEEWQPKNWNEIIDAAEKIKKSSDTTIPLAMGVAKANGESVSMQTFEMLLYGTNDTLYDADTKQWDVSSDGMLDSLNFINEVFNEKKLGPSLSTAINSNYSSVIFDEKFPKDEVGMAFDGYWNTGHWIETGAAPVEDMTERFGFAAMPTQNGGEIEYTTMVGGWSWAIPEKAKNKEASWKVLQALGSKQQILDRGLAEGTQIARDDSAEMSEYTSKPFIKEATEYLEFAHFRPKNDKYPNVSVEIQTMVESVATGTKTPEEALKTYEENVTRIVGEENIVK